MRKLSKHLFLLTLLFILPMGAYAQSYKPNSMFFKKAKVGYIYKYITGKNEVTNLRYLGSVRTSNGLSYKILTSVWIWGPSHRATNRILIYDNKNNYLGNYYLTMMNELPRYIQDNILIFTNEPRTCIAKVAFTAGVPKQIYNPCTKDIYKFDAK